MPGHLARPLQELPSDPALHAAANVSAGVVLAACIAALLALELGPLASHMLLHVLLMSVAAPLCAVGLERHRRSEWGAPLLWTATFLQVTLLWAWHVPMLHAAAQVSFAGRAIMMASLFFAAVAFWSAILLTPSRSTWQAMLALLVTGKLACLLGALLVFSPRNLYAHPAAHDGHALATLGDQQLAGLLMLAACPLSYVLAAIILSAQMIDRLARAGQAGGLLPRAARR